jgi:hypothetical protein
MIVRSERLHKRMGQAEIDTYRREAVSSKERDEILRLRKMSCDVQRELESAGLILSNELDPSDRLERLSRPHDDSHSWDDDVVEHRLTDEPRGAELIETRRPKGG